MLRCWKNKNDCDRIMVDEINNIPYKDRHWGTYAIKQIINTKQKLGIGNNFTMEDLSNELNKPVINKFERKKVIVIHIQSCLIFMRTIARKSLVLSY